MKKRFLTTALAAAMAASMFATTAMAADYKVGIIDADITGPSIPKAFGVNSQIVGNGSLMFPA